LERMTMCFAAAAGRANIYHTPQSNSHAARRSARSPAASGVAHISLGGENSGGIPRRIELPLPVLRLSHSSVAKSTLRVLRGSRLGGLSTDSRKCKTCIATPTKPMDHSLS
jgi:hypothetical protein